MLLWSVWERIVCAMADVEMENGESGVENGERHGRPPYPPHFFFVSWNGNAGPFFCARLQFGVIFWFQLVLGFLVYECSTVGFTVSVVHSPRATGIELEL